MRQYVQSHAQDELLKIYRREYMRRFAWIRVGKNLAESMFRVELGSAEGKREVRKQRDLAEGIYAVVKTVNPYYFLKRLAQRIHL